MLCFLGQKNSVQGCPDFTACFTTPHASSTRDGPRSETPYSAGSAQQPPAACMQRGTGMLYTQSHPGGVAMSPAFIRDRAGCP